MVRASIDGYYARAQEQGTFHSIFRNIQREVRTLRMKREGKEKYGDERTGEKVLPNNILPSYECEESREVARRTVGRTERCPCYLLGVGHPSLLSQSLLRAHRATWILEQTYGSGWATA